MITGYLRPHSLEEALGLAARDDAVVLGGGTVVNAHPGARPVMAVDLQALDLAGIRADPGGLYLGATTRLQELVDSDLVPDALRELARLEAPEMIRNAATVGGLIGRADPESPLLTGLLAFDARVAVARVGSSAEHPLDAILADRRLIEGSIITGVTVPGASRQAGVTVPGASRQAAAHGTARTPMDRPIVLVVACRSADGTVRIAVSGVAPRPTLVDPQRLDELDQLAQPADFRGSSSYRAHLAAVLVSRALADVGGSDRP